MKLVNIILGVFFVTTIISCDKKRDNLFDSSPTDRLSASVENVYQVLQLNSSRWMMEYYPSSDLEFGGYTMFFSFSGNVNVTVEGDFTSMTPQASTFSVFAGAGPILSFDTYNPILHFFALPGVFNSDPFYQLPGFYNGTSGLGASNEGMKGESDFLVLKATADSVIIEGRRSYIRIIMRPIHVNNASNIISDYKNAVAKFHPFGTYRFEIGDKIISAKFKTKATKRAFSIEGTTYPYRYTPDGLDFYQEYELEGVKFKKLKYVEPVGAYAKGYFTNDAATIKLVPTT